MPRFLSNEWLDALDRAVHDCAPLREAARGRHLVLEQTVTDAPGGDAAYHVQVDDGEIRVRPGRAPSDVRLETDYATAVAVNMGTDSAQAAFMQGRLRLGGDVSQLLRNAELFTLIDDVFEGVRSRTSY
jgi:hypothetical protein